MRIAMIYDAIFPYVIGGGERMFGELAARMAPAGHEVHLFGQKFWDGPADVRQASGVWLHGICPNIPLFKGDRRRLYQALRFASAVPPALWRWGRFDVINCMSVPYFPVYATRLALLARPTPLVVTWLECWHDYWHEYMAHGAALAKWMEWAAIRLSPRVISISERTSEGLRSAGLAEGRIHLIPPGINYGELAAIEPATEPLDILFAGRLVQHKRVDLLLEALALVRRELPQVRCSVIGDGPERAALEAQAQRLGLGDSVRLLGFLPDSADVYRLMKAARVFTFLSEREGFGIVALEAAACGLPVVALDAPNNATAGLVRAGRFGELCQGQAPEEVARRIVAILGDEAHHRELAERGRVWARDFDWDEVTRQTLDVYRVAIEGKPAAR